MLVDIGLKCQTKSQLTFETYTGNIPVTLINQGHPKIFIDNVRPFSLAELEVRGMDSSISINKFYLFTKNGYILLEPLWPKWKLRFDSCPQSPFFSELLMGLIRNFSKNKFNVLN